MVEIIAFLVLGQNWTFFKGLTLCSSRRFRHHPGPGLNCPGPLMDFSRVHQFSEILYKEFVILQGYFPGNLFSALINYIKNIFVILPDYLIIILIY